ncbi:MAG: hypothetical protein NUW06_01585 [Candidatus Acetothermia bacterium]|jgi:hypothetical protein|nr:hypothetical protein [Candidatus Acetothermia bacterium]MDH7505319.1 hypothetical protein [Candidatus Acetothermia bacterium]
MGKERFRFRELLYIQWPCCRHRQPVAELYEVRKRLREKLLPGEDLCHQAKSILSQLDLSCERCKRRKFEVLCLDAKEALTSLLEKYKAWLYQNETSIIKSFLKDIDSGRGLTWKQIETFEKIKRYAVCREQPKVVTTIKTGRGNRGR